MHYPIINDKKSVIAIFVFVTFFSCQNVSTSKQQTENNPTVRCDSMNEQQIENRSIIHRDSIIYELPEKTVIVIKKLIAGKKISLCYAGTYCEKDGYYFTFPYDDKRCYDHRDSILLSKTNRFLKIDNKYYPIMNSMDDQFINIPREGGCINDFNSCSVGVDVRGNFLDSMAW